MKLIILDAGDSYQLDGYNKLLLKNPLNEKTILENYLDVFNVKVEDVHIVVGYNSIPLMSAYSNFQYTYNSNWQTTGNSYSLAMVMEDEPCYIVSSDFFISEDIVAKMNQYHNCMWVRDVENKKLNSIKCSIENTRLKDVYRGKSKENTYEVIGLFKITSQKILQQLRKNLNLNPSLYVVENIPYQENVLNVIIDENNSIYEVNSPQDYIKFMSIMK